MSPFPLVAHYFGPVLAVIINRLRHPDRNFLAAVGISVLSFFLVPSVSGSVVLGWVRTGGSDGQAVGSPIRPPPQGALSVALDYTTPLSYTFFVKEIAYSRTAQKALTRMPRNWAERIMEKIRAYAEDPESQANNITGLKGSDGLSRLRVGDWRIIMRSGVVLHVLDVTIRGSAYKE